MKGLLFTYFLTYGGAVASLFNPFVGLMIYYCFAIIRPESLWFWSVPQGNYSRIIAFALLLGWGVNGFGNWRFQGFRSIALTLLALWGWIAISASLAVDPTRSWRHVEELSKIFLPSLVGMTLIDTLEKVKITAWVLMLSQAYVSLELNLAYYDGFNRLREAGFGGMDNNGFSVAAVSGAGMAFFLGLGDPIWWRKLIAYGSAAIMAHVPMFGFSRGGMLALVVLSIVAFWLIPKQPKHIALFALAVVLGLRLAGPEVIQRFTSTFASSEHRDGSAQSRIDLWSDCMDVMLKNPVFGVGPNQWPKLAPSYGWTENKSGHSLWMQMGAELGFPGLGLLLAFYGATIWKLWGMLNQSELEPWFANTARMVIAALAGFAVSAQFVSLEGLELPYYIVVLGATTLRVATLHVGDLESEGEITDGGNEHSDDSLGSMASPVA